MSGAVNMLLRCAHAQPGEHVLIAYEPASYGYFDDDVHHDVATTARDLGLTVETMDVGFTPFANALPDPLKARMEQADIVIFLARLGDQLRFSEMPKDKRIVVSFALNRALLNAPFCTTQHDAMLHLKDCVTEALMRADDIHVTCPRGTDLRGTPAMPDTTSGDTSILRFPMSVFKPVPGAQFSGRAAICGFLTGTGAHYYDGYTVEFDGPVLAVMECGRLIGFEGSPRDVATAHAQYDRVANLFGIDRNCVHSWHAGIHPACAFTQDARQDYERWSGLAFGNPRILHFHTCGDYAPGEISINVLDPTIRFDGVPVWQDGTFHPARLKGGQEILDTYPSVARIFAHPDRRVGLDWLDARTAPLQTAR
ncbi:hypothetical protein [Marivita sp. S2033]|uniref:hypothetical protein n=1 Tax=Marivita sp. S2033 TaxID=3373187 RepID=UPI003981AF5E